jgi:HKD family nuclease
MQNCVVKYAAYFTGNTTVGSNPIVAVRYFNKQTKYDINFINTFYGLKTELKKADEIWVAVGLLNNSGLQFILITVNISCRLKFIVGIDLPTAPKALSKLLSLKSKRRITAKILTEDFFHPKVYIIKSQRQSISFVGSANCTMGGLKENIEMSIVTKDSAVSKNLIDWFEKELLPNSQPLTADFIKDYKPKYDNRIKRRKKEKKEIQGLKKRRG